MKKPLLTIAIPTWNRARYLRLNLEQLDLQVHGVAGSVEILVSDNGSSDETPFVIEDFVGKGLPIRHIRNDSNIGSDHNIAQCFNLAAGRYVLILGDDDLLVAGALATILDQLRRADYGVVSMRAYGYDDDFRREFRRRDRAIVEFADLEEFIYQVGILATFISTNVICKESLAEEDARNYCGTNLVHTHLMYLAASKAERNLWIDDYLIACKRANSGGYAFSEVFVDSFGSILDGLRGKGISGLVISRLEQRLLLTYYPFYIWRQRLGGGEDLRAAWWRFRLRYSSYVTFWLCVAPILRLPRAVALLWGGVVVLIGRTLNGDFLRGLSFARTRLMRIISPKVTP